MAMEQHCGLGLIAVITRGLPHLHPLELTLADGIFWAAVSRTTPWYRDLFNGQHIELVFLDEGCELPPIRGLLALSTAPVDRQRLWRLQGDRLDGWCGGEDDPRLVVLKIIPDAESFDEPDDIAIHRKAA